MFCFGGIWGLLASISRQEGQFSPPPRKKYGTEQTLKSTSSRVDACCAHMCVYVRNCNNAIITFSSECDSAFNNEPRLKPSHWKGVWAGNSFPYAIPIYVRGASTFVSLASGLGKPILCNGWMSLLLETGPNVEWSEYRLNRNWSPPVGWYQIILLGDRGTRVLTTCPGLHSTAGRLGRL